MSLILTWFSQDFIGIVSDGRSSFYADDGALVPLSEDRSTTILQDWRSGRRWIQFQTP
jgi:hypothetical protein